MCVKVINIIITILVLLNKNYIIFFTESGIIKNEVLICITPRHPHNIIIQGMIQKGCKKKLLRTGNSLSVRIN